MKKTIKTLITLSKRRNSGSTRNVNGITIQNKHTKVAKKQKVLSNFGWKSNLDRPLDLGLSGFSDTEKQELIRISHVTTANKRRYNRPRACEQCSCIVSIHGHHPDYRQPTQVIWLCAHCHSAEHERINCAVAQLRG